MRMRRIGHILFSFIVFLALSVGVYRWQSYMQASRSISLLPQEKLNFAVGLCEGEARQFFYFYYYLRLLPVVSVGISPTVYSQEGAEEFVQKNGASLSNDLSGTCSLGRAGDWGKFLLLFPNAWQTGSAANATTIPATAFLFKLSLIGLLAAAFLTRSYLLGMVLVLLCGSYSTQLYEVYGRDSVLSVALSCCLILLALNFRFVCSKSAKSSRWDWMLAAISGLVLGLGAVIRGECLPIALSVIGLYLISGQRFVRMALMCVVFVSSLLLTRKGFEVYFDFKVNEAHQFVLNHGGTIRTGETLRHHPFWHAIAAGLGDFGKDAGFVWEDRALYSLALPAINKKLGRNYSLQGYYYVEPGSPEQQWVRAETLPEYSQFMREMVLSKISSDPWWYAKILKQRIITIASAWSSVCVQWGRGDIRLPQVTWLFIPLIVACVMMKRSGYLKLIAFSLPTCFIPLFVTSIGGAHNYSIVHLLVVAAGLDATYVLCRHFVQTWRDVRTRKVMAAELAAAPQATSARS